MSCLSLCPSAQVVEVEAEPMPLGPANPHGVGFDIVERVLGREAEAQRMCAPERSRVWKVRRLQPLGPQGRPAQQSGGCAGCPAAPPACPGNRLLGSRLPEAPRAPPFVTSPLPPPRPGAGAKPQQHQPGDGQTCGLEAHAGQPLPSHAGPRKHARHRSRSRRPATQTSLAAIALVA